MEALEMEEIKGCDFCGRKAPKQEGRFYPKGWDAYCWRSRALAMCKRCLRAVDAFLSVLKKA